MEFESSLKSLFPDMTKIIMKSNDCQIFEQDSSMKKWVSANIEGPVWIMGTLQGPRVSVINSKSPENFSELFLNFKKSVKKEKGFIFIKIKTGIKRTVGLYIKNNKDSDEIYNFILKSKNDENEDSAVKNNVSSVQGNGDMSLNSEHLIGLSKLNESKADDLNDTITESVQPSMNQNNTINSYSSNKDKVNDQPNRRESNLSNKSNKSSELYDSKTKLPVQEFNQSSKVKEDFNLMNINNFSKASQGSEVINFQKENLSRNHSNKIEKNTTQIVEIKNYQSEIKDNITKPSSPQIITNDLKPKQSIEQVSDTSITLNESIDKSYVSKKQDDSQNPSNTQPNPKTTSVDNIFSDNKPKPQDEFEFTSFQPAQDQNINQEFTPNDDSEFKTSELFKNFIAHQGNPNINQTLNDSSAQPNPNNLNKDPTFSKLDIKNWFISLSQDDVLIDYMYKKLLNVHKTNYNNQKEQFSSKDFITQGGANEHQGGQAMQNGVGKANGDWRKGKPVNQNKSGSQVPNKKK